MTTTTGHGILNPASNLLALLLCRCAAEKHQDRNDVDGVVQSCGREGQHSNQPCRELKRTHGEYGERKSLVVEEITKFRNLMLDAGTYAPDFGLRVKVKIKRAPPTL